MTTRAFVWLVATSVVLCGMPACKKKTAEPPAGKVCVDWAGACAGIEEMELGVGEWFTHRTHRAC